jgi:PKD repeat protein
MGTAPLPVSFTDASTGSPTGWNWTFGDIGGANTSTSQNPSHTYTSAGTYSVNLTVINAGGPNTLIKMNYITVFPPPPVANFIGSPTAGWPPPLAVSFTDASTGSPASWSWNFGDIGSGNTSTLQSPSHMYTAGGAYSVNLTVSNAGGSNSMIKTNYITLTPNPPWYNCNWVYRKNITIDKSRVSGTLSDIPVMINVASDNDLKNGARSDGYDILFTSSDGTTKLPHEIETYTGSTGALVAWVKVPTVTDSMNTTIFMYYGYPASPNQQNKNGVWNSNYKAVWHLKEDPSGASPQMLDSTSNANHGTSAGTMTTSDQVAAKINGGLDFDGSNDYLGTTYVQTGVTAYTIEVWIKTPTTSMQRVIVHDRGSGAGMSLTLEVGGTYPGGPGAAGNVGYGVDSNNIYIGRFSTSTVNDNNWHHLVGVWAAPPGTAIAPAQFSIYIDGTAAATGNAVVGSATSPLTGSGGTQLAYHQPWVTYLPGILDEVRISTSSLSADWIKTEYNNQNTPSTFYYLMNQEQWTC